MKKESKLEIAFSRQMSMANLPEWKTEFYFHVDRRWRLDFAWPDVKVGVEIHGGTYSKSPWAHRNGTQLHGAYEKMNAAQTAGWIVLQLDEKHVRSGDGLTMLFDALATRGAIRTQIGVGEFSLKR